MEDFVKYAVMGGVILLMFGVGMGTSFRQVVEAIRQFGVVMRGVLVGEPEAKRKALAVSTAIRNIPLAFLIATASFPESAVGPVTLVFSVLTMILSVLYGKLRKSTQQ